MLDPQQKLGGNILPDRPDDEKQGQTGAQAPAGRNDEGGGQRPTSSGRGDADLNQHTMGGQGRYETFRQPCSEQANQSVECNPLDEAPERVQAFAARLDPL